MPMNIAKLTRLPPVEQGFLLDAKLPVISLAIEVSPLKMQAREIGSAAVHVHPRGQLIYASSGMMRVICSRDVWVVPPSQAVWVPPNQEHEVYFPGDTALRSLFVDPSAVTGLPLQCTVLKVAPLLRELILRAVQIGNSYAPDGAEWRVMQVLLDELRIAEATPLRLPMARDERVMRVIDALLKSPGDNRGLDAWGKIAGASSRTLARLFVSETGLTFGGWRKRLLLHKALDRLDRGEQVTGIAFDLGYQSLSAFIEMFRKELGVSPRRYARVNRSITN
ncbi:transcriptional regulator, AraC family [Geotalea uraniireducens Rf4]|uniref:Transcriptional regulator, AraC family n=2 Tax=Geotalea uraniireducens TaxID=351604 RepID=A5GBQ3_GEOUR|nr:transcriptional regulator, AraC family [Geotalea uraniireducens Rf4]